MNDIYFDIYEKLSTLQWLMKRHQMFCQTESGPFADTTKGQGRIIAILKMQSEIATKDLAYILGIRQQSLNELIKKLEKNGYVERVPSEADGRVLLVRLTEKGKNIPDISYDCSAIFKGFSKEELNEFSDYLERIIASLEEETGEVFDENFYNWMTDARERMTDEEFKKMLSMRQGVFNRFGGCNMFNRENNARGFGFLERGKAPEGMPGAERFDPDYDGPMPEGRKSPFGFASQKVSKEEKSSDKNYLRIAGMELPI